MTSLKYMAGTNNFLDLIDEKKQCGVKTYEQCKQDHFLEVLDRTCGCVPFGYDAVTNIKVQ